MEMSGVWFVLVGIERIAFRDMVATMANWNNKSAAAYAMSNAGMIRHKTRDNILAVIAHTVVG